MNDNADKLCIDLGSGLCGASAAFKDAGWEVVTLDIDRRFRPTVQADYSLLPFRTGLKPEMVIAAPDCSCFSIMALRFHWKKTPHGLEPRDIRTVDAVRDTWELVDEIKRLDPEYAVIENPRGMVRHILGRPQHTVRWSDHGSPFKKPTDLWEFGTKRLAFRWLEGMGGWLHIPRSKKKRATIAKKLALEGKRLGIQMSKTHWMGVQAVKTPQTIDDWNRHPPHWRENTVKAKSLRAKWPYGLSKAVMEACEGAD